MENDDVLSWINYEPNHPLILYALTENKQVSTAMCRFLRTDVAIVPEVVTDISVLPLFSGCSSVVHL